MFSVRASRVDLPGMAKSAEPPRAGNIFGTQIKTTLAVAQSRPTRRSGGGGGVTVNGCSHPGCDIPDTCPSFRVRSKK